MVRSMTCPLIPSFKVTFGLKFWFVPKVPPASKMSVIGLPTSFTKKEWETGVAAFHPRLPSCFAVTVTKPPPFILRVEPDAVTMEVSLLS